MFAVGFIFNCVFVVAIFPQRKFRNNTFENK